MCIEDEFIQRQCNCLMCNQRLGFFIGLSFNYLYSNWKLGKLQLTKCQYQYQLSQGV